MLKAIKRLIQKEKKKSPRKMLAEEFAALRLEIANAPMDAELHGRYALLAARKNLHFLAYAELKTAEWLGLSKDLVRQQAGELLAALPDLMDMNHNQWFRLHTLASKVKRESSGKVSVLDVGGGEGWLAAFLPEMDYCLVEPDNNGISGINLPFADKSFDYVISCHVLEHIPAKERNTYLSQLVAKARKAVLLLNPFHEDGQSVEEQLQLCIDVTNERWAHEHLDCGLPKVSDVQEFAQANGFRCTVEPNGTMTTTLGLVFMDHFAAEPRHQDKWKKINRFFNEKYADIMTTDIYPTAYLISIDVAVNGS